MPSVEYPVRTVQVLLSTYNGVKFLQPLLNSLLDQDWPSVDVLVRDDGSTDGTVDLVEQYCVRPNFRAVREGNVGVVRSFFRLLHLSAPTAAYVAFCDQDDVWERDKLSRAVAALSNTGDHEPLM